MNYDRIIIFSRVKSDRIISNYNAYTIKYPNLIVHQLPVNIIMVLDDVVLILIVVIYRTYIYYR